MEPELQEAISVIEKACASVTGDLTTHQVIQHALGLVKSKLGAGLTLEPESNGKEPAAAKKK
jgi:hypothetical protein